MHAEAAFFIARLLVKACRPSNLQGFGDAIEAIMATLLFFLSGPAASEVTKATSVLALTLAWVFRTMKDQVGKFEMRCCEGIVDLLTKQAVQGVQQNAGIYELSLVKPDLCML